MISKPLLIGGAVAAVAAIVLLTGGTSHAAQGPALPPPTPEPPAPLPPAGPGQIYEIPEVVVQGDPAAIDFNPDTRAAAIDVASRVQAGAGVNCSYVGAIQAFQNAYNHDPTSQHPENVLGTYDHPVFHLTEDGKFGINTATAVFYVSGAQLAPRC